MKLLGFQFSNKPNCHAEIDNLINKAAGRTFVICRLDGVKVNKERLKNVYCSIVRSVLEYSGVTYGPMIAQYQKNRPENIQKSCPRSIFRFDKSYSELLEEAGLKTLEERRAIALRKFAEKAAKNNQFKYWFPLNPNRASQRSGIVYLEKHAKSDRLYNSPLFEMRRALNNSEKENCGLFPDKIDLADLYNINLNNNLNLAYWNTNDR